MLKSGLFFSLIKKLRLLKYFLLKSEAIFCKKEDITLKVLHYLLVSHWAAFKKKLYVYSFICYLNIPYLNKQYFARLLLNA